MGKGGFWGAGGLCIYAAWRGQEHPPSSTFVILECWLGLMSAGGREIGKWGGGSPWLGTALRGCGWRGEWGAGSVVQLGAGLLSAGHSLTLTSHTPGTWLTAPPQPCPSVLGTHGAAGSQHTEGRRCELQTMETKRFHPRFLAFLKKKMRTCG